MYIIFRIVDLYVRCKMYLLSSGCEHRSRRRAWFVMFDTLLPDYLRRQETAAAEGGGEVRVWRKLCLSGPTCLFSDWISRSLFYLQHLILVCSSARAYLIISTSLSTNNFLLRLSKQYLWLKPTLLSAGRDYYFVRKPSVMLMICLIFLSPKVREGSVGGPQSPAWICHSTAFRPPHRYSPASADYPTFQSVPPLSSQIA